MVRRIEAGGRQFQYELNRKKVKNINLRVKRDGSIVVSAPSAVPVGTIEEFLESRAAWLGAALDKIERHREENPPLQRSKLPDDPEIFRRFDMALAYILPRFHSYGVQKPIVKIRTMKTRWGSCHYLKGQITLNRLLVLLPEDCLNYVVAHELAHFVYHDHSKNFYGVLDRVMPGHRQIRNSMRQIRWDI